MKINYLFPVFKNNNCNEFLEKFLNSRFFNTYKDYKIIFCCSKLNNSNLKYLKNKCKENKKIKLLIFDKDFTYNDAFDEATKIFDGDVVLLGDLEIEKIDVVFEKCLEKHKNGANVVHVVKKHKGFKGFIANFLGRAYNFFIKIFTNKRDRLNIISLGLIDKNLIELFKVLPKKRCFLKNTKNLLGFESRTVYVSSSTKTYNLNFKKMSGSLKTVLISAGCCALALLLIILLNALLSVFAFVNIVLIGIILISLILISLFLPKHIFDVRNFKTKKEIFDIKEIN